MSLRNWFLGLALTSVAWADPRISVEVRKSSDLVEVRLVHSMPLSRVSQRWSRNPQRLEVVVPYVDYQGKASFPVDKGVVQRVEVKPTAQDGIAVQVYTLQNPKMSWSSSSDRRIWTLKISTIEMAASSSPPDLPGHRAPAKALADIAVQPNRPSLAPAPKPRAQPQPQPRHRPAPGARPAGPEQKLITVNFKDKDLASAIREMAFLAGMEADIGSEVEGKVSVDFAQVPLARALTHILGRQSKLYEFKIVNNRLQVRGDEQAGGNTLAPTAAGAASPLVSEYFPIAADQSLGDWVQVVRKALGNIEVFQDDRLNVLFVRGQAQEVERIRDLLQKAIAK